MGNHTSEMGQPYHGRYLQSLPVGSKFDDFRCHRALFSWLRHTRSELACYANRAAKVFDQTFGTDKILELNQGSKTARDSALNALRYKQLDISSLESLVYADASFASNDDLSFQLGFLVYCVTSQTSAMYSIGFIKQDVQTIGCHPIHYSEGYWVSFHTAQ